MGLKDLLKRERIVLPSEEVQKQLIMEIEEKLLSAEGSEKTKLTYMLANQMIFMDQIRAKKKSKKPIKLNNMGKWVWVEDA
jgi:hypothetical protein